MPLTHIQLRPKKEAPALGRALKKEKPKKVFGPTYVPREIKPYAGPTPVLGGEKAPAGVTPSHFRPGAGTLEEALRAATPATGKAVDIQARAWARRKEIVAEEQARLDKEADALYGAVQDLSPKDQDYLLSKVVGKARPAALGAALGAKPGAISPAAVRTDPLMQTMIDKHYIRLDEKGEYSWMLPMKEKAVADVRTWTDEQGWLQQTTTFEDATTETIALGREAKEAITTGLTSSEQLGWARLQFDVDKAGAIHVSAALKERGEAPIEGVTMVDRPGGKKRKATADDVAAYWQAIKTDADYRRVAAEGINTKEDIKIKYQYDTEAIKNFQRNIPGMVVDGKWSDMLEQTLSDLLIKEE